MTYEKPEVVVCSSAVQAIQNLQKDNPIAFEDDKQPSYDAAYEADE